MSSNIRKNNIIKVVSPKDNFSAKQIGSQDFNLDVTSDKVGHELNKVPLIKAYEQRYEKQNTFSPTASGFVIMDTVNNPKFPLKDVILDNVSKNIENNFTSQINNLDKLSKYENNWTEYYKDKDFKGMEKEYEKIKEKLKELMPLEETLKQARQIENIHKIIKNNGGDFNLTPEQLELSKILV